MRHPLPPSLRRAISDGDPAPVASASHSTQLPQFSASRESAVSLDKMATCHGQDTAICPFCDMPFREGDRLGIPASKNTRQCSVSMLCDNPKSVGTVSSL